MFFRLFFLGFGFIFLNFFAYNHLGLKVSWHSFISHISNYLCCTLLPIFDLLLYSLNLLLINIRLPLIVFILVIMLPIIHNAVFRINLLYFLLFFQFLNMLQELFWKNLLIFSCLVDCINCSQVVKGDTFWFWDYCIDFFAK